MRSKSLLTSLSAAILVTTASIASYFDHPITFGVLIVTAIICLMIGAEIRYFRLRTMILREREVSSRNYKGIYSQLSAVLTELRHQQAGIIGAGADRVITDTQECTGGSEVNLSKYRHYVLNEKSSKLLSGNTSNHGGLFFGVGPDYEYGVRVSEGYGVIETFALRSKSYRVRNAIARGATRLQFGYDDLISLLRHSRKGNVPGINQVAEYWDPKALLLLARVVFCQRLVENDPKDAVYLFRMAEGVFGRKYFGKRDPYVYAEALQDVNQYTQARRVLTEYKVKQHDKVQWQLMLLNETLSELVKKDSPETERVWLNRLNELFSLDQLSPVNLDGAEEGRRMLDRLNCTVRKDNALTDTPLVTVIIPTFNGSRHVGTALKSIRAQTWPNIEVIVVDDGSDREELSNIRMICTEYRAILVELRSNQGAYHARNVGLSEAHGEFVTIHDDDDWSHPQKIERQASYLFDNPDTVGTLSLHVRVSEDCRFNRINNNPVFAQKNFSSLMFRREIARSLGGWDEVLRGADAEFRDALIQAYGSEAVVTIGRVPLSFTRVRDTSLTSGEISFGYVDPNRLVYAASYERSHRQSSSRDLTFVKPLSMTVAGRETIRSKRYDVVFATDFRFPGGTSMLTLNEAELAANSGLTVGLVHIESPLNSTKSPLNERFFSVASHENIDILALKDQATIALLVVRHPSVLQYADTLASGLNVGMVVCIVNNAPISDSGTKAIFDLRDVRANMARLFGATQSLIVPESGVTRSACMGLGIDDVLADFDWNGYVDVNLFVPGNGGGQANPVIGRHSRDHRMKWPNNTAEIAAIYLHPGEASTRVLGGVSSLSSSSRNLLETQAEIYKFGEIEPQTFLKSLDFWVYYHSDDTFESFGMAVVEALAAGLVVVLPPYMRDTFGEGPVYVEPEHAWQTIMRIWKDKAAFMSYRKRSRKLAEDMFSQECALARLVALSNAGRMRLDHVEA